MEIRTAKATNAGTPRAEEVSLLVAAFRIRGFFLENNAGLLPQHRRHGHLGALSKKPPRAKVHEHANRDRCVLLASSVATIGAMATLFTKIIRGELPGRFVWRDDRVVAFLTIAPLQPGHVLVVPIEEVDHWLDLDADLMAHLMDVSQTIGRAVDRAFEPEKVGMMIAGLEIPHVHVHIVPMSGVRDLDFANADPDPSPESLDEAAARIRTALAEFGEEQGQG
jgi:histidine triad (HIT) family protein